MKLSNVVMFNLAKISPKTDVKLCVEYVYYSNNASHF